MTLLTLDDLQGLGRIEPSNNVIPGRSGFAGIVIDSRRVTPGDLFVAIGRGVDFVGEALERGAAAALVPNAASAALGVLARSARSRSSARVVAVTGSTGKTSTKDILAALCRPHARTVAAEAGHNNELGLPLTVARLGPETQVLVTEMGMRGLGQIAALCQLARPEIAVITNVAPVHLELLGTVERVAQAKAEVVASLPAGGTAVVPARAPELEPHLGRDDVALVRFGAGGAVQLDRFEPPLLVADVAGERVELEVPFTARHHATNTLAALAAYRALGLPLERAAEGAREIQLSPLRGEESKLPGGGLLINDSYNANPVSMRAALEHLVARAAGRRTIAVLGDMAELGPGAPAFHRRVGEDAAELGIDVLVAVGPLAREYVNAATGIPVRVHVQAADEAAAALERAGFEDGDVVLVKASRAVGLERVADELLRVRA